MSATAPSTAVAIRPASSGFGLVMSPQTVEDTRKFCQMLAATEFVPKAFRGKPDSIMVVGAMGARLGVDVFTAMAGIADINGKPCVYGDLMMAVCLNHPEFEDCLESLDGKAYEDAFQAVCTVKRKGREPVTRTFSVIEAKEANLWKKAGPWTSTPQRMLQMRARAFALRDTFADALAGMHAVEEMEGLVDVTATATVHAEPQPAKRRTVPAVESKPEPTKGAETVITKQTPPADEPPAEQTQTGDITPPAKPEPTVTRCQDVTAALMKRGAGGKALVAGIMKRWSLALVTDLAQLTDDDRQAYIDEVAEADAKLEPVTGGGK
jgi:hypothetical protein